MFPFMVSLGRDHEVELFWLDLGNNPFSYLTPGFHRCRLLQTLNQNLFEVRG
jgi:hypothetical protein